MSTRRCRLAALIILLTAAGGSAVDLKNRSTSSSGQFVVYCDDRHLRGRVVTFAEEVKSDVLRILQMRDSWSMPIVITMDAASPAQPPPPVIVQLVNTIAGPKIDVIVKVGSDPSTVYLQRHIIRAVLLELMYHDRPPLKADQPYVEAPWWIVQGFIESIRRREEGAAPDIFKSIIASDKLPPLDTFLQRPPRMLDSTAGTVDRACALCLFEALRSLPDGPQKLGRFITRWPDSNGDTMTALRTHFPELTGNAQSLPKWWSLQLTRFAKGDAWRGQTLADTDRELTEALELQVDADGKGRVESFPIAEFEKFVKLPGARTALQAARVKIVTLSTRANPLFRPILTEYEAIIGALSARKTRNIATRIADIESYRANLVRQMDQITDYLNWYEATQPGARADGFGKFLKAAADFDRKPDTAVIPADPRITDYLDNLEKELAPLLPDTIPGNSPPGAASR